MEWRFPVAARDCLRGQPLRWSDEDETEQSTHLSPRSGSPCHRGLEGNLPGHLSGGPDVPHLWPGKRKGEAVPRWGKNFLKWRIRPVAQKLGIPDRLVTFQVMRRTLGTDMQKHGTLKDTQGILRHASIRTTGDIYVQSIDASVQQAVNSHTSAVLNGWTAPVENMGVEGRNLRGLSVIRRSRERSLL